jgi:hypothetical protein
MKNHRRPGPVGRLAEVMMAGALAVPWIGPAGGAGVAGGTAADGSPPPIYEARAEAGAVTDSLSVPAQIETSTPYSLSEANNDSSHGVHAVIYPGLLLSAAAFQQGLPPPPGTTETLYPQGPVEGQADVVPLPAEFGGGPGSTARSAGHSGPTGSFGEARYGGFSPATGVSVQFGQARTSATAGSVVRSAAEVVLQQVRIGGFAADTVTTTAEATADGSRDGGRASGSVKLAGATLMGTPVTLGPTGLTVGGTTAELPTTPTVDELLAQAGVSVRRLPDTETKSPDGTESRLEIGGLEVRLDQPGQEFSTAFVLGRASVRARAVRLTAAPGIPPQIPSQPEFKPETPTQSELFPGVAGSLLSGPLPAAQPESRATAPAPGPPPTVAGETLVAPLPPAASPPPGAPAQSLARPTAQRDAVHRADWSGLSALIALAAPGALILRRILRLVAAP